MTDQEITECMVRFTAELVNQLVATKEDVESETQRLYETRELATAYDSRSSSVGLMCIAHAAEHADWYAVSGLTSALFTSMDRHDSQSLENFLEHEAKESKRKYEIREAKKQKRLEQESSLPQQGPTPE